MSVMTENTQRAQDDAVRDIVRRLRTTNEEKALTLLDVIQTYAPADSMLRHLSSNKTRRAHLKRVAFPAYGADLNAIEIGLKKGNTIESLWHLANRTSFVFEGHRYFAQALRNKDGSWCWTRTGTLRVVYSEKRLAEVERNMLRVMTNSLGARRASLLK